MMDTLTLEDRKMILSHFTLHGKTEATKLKAIELLCRIEGDWVDKKEVTTQATLIVSKDDIAI